MYFPDMFKFLDSKLFWFIFIIIIASGLWKITELVVWLLD